MLLRLVLVEEDMAWEDMDKDKDRDRDVAMELAILE